VLPGLASFVAMQLWITSAPRKQDWRAWLSVNGASTMVIRGEDVDSRPGNALMSFALERTKMLRLRSLGGDSR
jgi:hypothetical protein